MKKEFYFKEGCYIMEMLNDPNDPEVSIARARVKPGVTTKWHSLNNTTERYLVRHGEGFAEKGQEAGVHLKPGDVFTIPAGVRQRITNTGSEDLMFLAVCTPRFEESNYTEEA